MLLSNGLYKSKNKQQSNKQSESNLVTLLSPYFSFVGYPSAPSSSIPFFKSSSLTEIPKRCTFSHRPTFLGDILFRCFVSST